MEARVLLGDPGSEPYAVRTIARPGASLDDLGERAVSMEPEVAGAAERARELGAHRVERGVVEEEHRPRLGRVPPVLHREQPARITPNNLRQLKHHHVYMGGGSIQLARVFGIRVGVSPSWFFILFLMIYSLSGYFDSVLSGSRNTAYAVAVAGAMKLSGRIGQAFGYGLIGLGIYLAMAGDAIDGIWFGLIGVFLGQAARGAVVSSQVSERIEGVTVADLMDTDPFTLSKDVTALEAQESLSRHGVVFAPIVDEARRYLGYVRAERIEGAVAAGQPVLPVGE